MDAGHSKTVRGAALTCPKTFGQHDLTCGLCWTRSKFDVHEHGLGAEEARTGKATGWSHATLHTSDQIRSGASTGTREEVFYYGQ
ncbi:hypothetical protein GCM10022252_34140 [Streptosporangium oxazolinicum]|uniref:Uncharacterized protein n=1 Tax=Streptosporangium oxazolinicum TaxID=909287 RepID=A0ABP8AXI0_9ACTN